MKEALYYTKLDEKRVCCTLCFRECTINNRKRGLCRNRENKDGVLYSLTYANPSALQVDPVEKEPQHHLLPGVHMLCFGTAGCNFRCRFCHNWHLSQQSIEDIGCFSMPPDKAVEFAKKKNIPVISFTYSEPTTFFEYAYEIAKEAKSKGIKILWHSNGGMNPGPLKQLLEYTDAVTIDLKGFSEKFYCTYCSSRLNPVLQTLKIIKQSNAWLEIVNLIIPSPEFTGNADSERFPGNADPECIRNMCDWIAENIGKNVPLHFSRFYPAHQMKDIAPTPVKFMEKAYTIAKKAGLQFVYLGNVPGHRYNSTICPSCEKVLINRIHFDILQNQVKDGVCSFCGYEIPGVWK